MVKRGIFEMYKSFGVLGVIIVFLCSCTDVAAKRGEIVRDAERKCGLADGALGQDVRTSDDHIVKIIGHKDEYWAPCVTRVIKSYGYAPALGSVRSKNNKEHVE